MITADVSNKRDKENRVGWKTETPVTFEESLVLQWIFADKFKEFTTCCTADFVD